MMMWQCWACTCNAFNICLSTCRSFTCIDSLDSREHITNRGYFRLVPRLPTRIAFTSRLSHIGIWNIWNSNVGTYVWLLFVLWYEMYFQHLQTYNTGQHVASTNRWLLSWDDRSFFEYTAEESRLIPIIYISHLPSIIIISNLVR